MRHRQKRLATLPVRQLAILAACRFAEPIASTSVFPYLPEMIESFGVEGKEIAKWAGITSAVFSLAQCLTAVAWGRLSDRIGRKPVILTGLTFTMISSLLWGLSSNLPTAIIARAVQGACNGNVGIIRTVVAELVPYKALQPRAFSIMPLVWTLGSIIGPSLGGALASPATSFPGLFGESWLLTHFPFLLPNLVAAVFFLIGIIIGILFLKETLETRKNAPDYGLRIGRQLVTCCRPKRKFRPTSDYTDETSASLLRPTSSASAASKSSFSRDYPSTPTPRPPPPKIREVLTRQSIINLIAYTFLAMHSVAFDQLLAVFMHTPQQVPTATNTHLPFKFAGGFGIDAGRIGILFTAYGIVGGFIQFIIFPPVARKYGVLRCLKVCAIVFPLLFIVVPYTALIQDSNLQQAAMFAVMIVKSFAVIFAFPCTTILLTNSAVSLRVLGTLNGLATSVSAVGRAAGPALAGWCFTRGVEIGYGIIPWWVLGAIAAAGAIPVWFIIESDGFSAPEEDDQYDDDDDSESLLPDINNTERGLLAGDENLPISANESAIDIIDGPPLSSRTRPSRAPGTPSAPDSASATGNATLSIPRRPPGQERRLSSPIGWRGGVGPAADRSLSTGLGASNSGVGSGGTSFH